MLLYQDLIQNKGLTGSGKLPPVVPIVLYNGLRPWTAPLELDKLIEPMLGDESFLPRFEYMVVDEGRLPREKLEPLDSPVAGVFQLEQSTGVEEIRRIIDTLIDVLDDPELRELRRDMATWLRRAVLPARIPGIEIPELQDLQEVRIMLAERAATWPQQWAAEGYQKGHESGLAEGRESGLAEGLRAALSELVKDKFGSPEPRFRKLIAEASKDQLKRWLKSVLTATTLDELFSDLTRTRRRADHAQDDP